VSAVPRLAPIFGERSTSVRPARRPKRFFAHRLPSVRRRRATVYGYNNIRRVAKLTVPVYNSSTLRSGTSTLFSLSRPNRHNNSNTNGVPRVTHTRHNTFRHRRRSATLQKWTSLITPKVMYYDFVRPANETRDVLLRLRHDGSRRSVLIYF